MGTAQGHRIGWTTNPVLAELAPLAWNEYVRSADQVSLVGGLSGAGYTYPGLMDGTELSGYLDRTADAFRRTGLRVVHIYSHTWPTIQAFRSLGPAYHQHLTDAGYLGAFVGFGDYTWGLPMEYADSPEPGIVPTAYDSLDVAIRDVQDRRLGDFTIRLADWPVLATGLGGEIVPDPSAPGGRAVRWAPADAGLVFSTPSQTLLPGTYRVTFTLAAAQRGSAADLADIYVGINDRERGSFDFLTRRYVRASDFAAAGEWQSFDVEFTLPDVARNVEFRIDHFEDVTELRASTIRVQRVSAAEDPLPVFAALFLNLVASYDKTRYAQVPDQLAAAGVVVVTPDEFVAALNPQYLLDLAQRRLGSDHPSLDPVRAHLAAGRYLDALLSVRAALAAG